MNNTNNINTIDNWKNNKYILNKYHLEQYKTEYESVKFIKKYIKNLVIKNILDLGCGAGSLCYHLNDTNIYYNGIDINNECIDIAKNNNNSNNSFINKSFTELQTNIKYDLVLSNQTLLIIEPLLQNNFIEKHFELSNNYVIFFSLFTDSLLNYETKIIDPYFNQVVFYNINSVNKIEEIGKKYKFKLIKNDKFEIKKKLEKNREGRQTYTIETNNNKLLQFSDVYYMPWKILLFKKYEN
tara:strand:+ start:53 stop:772 length:720 start_codon:yes stop_codon:yes gene_type:complete